MDAVKNTIPALAEAMEKLRENMIFFRFQLNHIANEWYAKDTSNLFNDFYARDTSKKIRAVFRAKGLSGKRLSTQVPYGYLMGENGQLIEDTETAPVVRLIFRLAIEGNGPGKIARILREKQIITPGTLIFQRTGRTDRYNPEFGTQIAWGIFWSKKTIRNPEEKQAVFENTHVALIDQETWDLVQKARQSRRRPTKMAEQMETLSVSKRQLEKQMRRIAEIDGIIKRLYEDNLSGKLFDSRFAKMNADYEQEQQILEASSADLRRAVDFCEEQTVNIKSFLKCVRKYTEPSELTPDMLHELVDKIVVHAPDKSGGHRTQQVDIYYNFVGKIPISEEVATRQTA